MGAPLDCLDGYRWGWILAPLSDYSKLTFVKIEMRDLICLAVTFVDDLESQNSMFFSVPSLVDDDEDASPQRRLRGARSLLLLPRPPRFYRSYECRYLMQQGLHLEPTQRTR